MFGTLVTILHVFACFVLILVVLLQAGKGGGMGITFGGGGSQTVFGSSGAGNFLTRMTAICAAIFMMTSLGLARQSSQQDSHRLQELAEKKIAEKKGLDESNAKAKTDIEKTREAIEKATGQKVDFTPPPKGADNPVGTVDNPLFGKPADLPKAAAPAGKAGAPAKVDDKGKGGDAALAPNAGKAPVDKARPDPVKSEKTGPRPGAEKTEKATDKAAKVDKVAGPKAPPGEKAVPAEAPAPPRAPPAEKAAAKAADEAPAAPPSP